MGGSGGQKSQIPKWRRFEELVAEIQRQLSPGASVEQNVRLRGRASGVERQIDVLIRAHAGQFDLTIVIDCKDYQRPVDVKTVEEFMGLASDVLANKAAIVASSGFTPAAKSRAQAAGIDLLQLVDTSPHDWQTFVALPTLVDDRSMRGFSCTFSGAPSALPTQRLASFAELELYTSGGTAIGKVGYVVSRMWNAGEIKSEVGRWQVPVMPGKTHLRTLDGAIAPIGIVANVEVQRTLYFGNLPLKEIQGFRNEVTGATVTKGFTTDFVDHAVVTKTWKKIGSQEELAVQPALTLCVCSRYPENEDELSESLAEPS